MRRPAPARPVYALVVQRFVARVKRTFTGLARRIGRGARWVAGGSLGALVITSGFFPNLEAHPVGSLVVLLGFFGLAGAGAAWAMSGALRLWGSFAEREVVIADGGVSVLHGETETRYDAARIVSGMVIPREDGAELRLVLDGGDTLRLRLPSVGAANDTLEALDLGPGEKRLAVRWSRFFHVFIAAFGGLAATTIPFLLLSSQVEGSALYLPASFLLLFVPWFAAGWATRWVGREVIAGTDGLRGRIGGRRFDVRFAELESLERRDGQMVLRRTQGPELVIPLDADDTGLREALAHRLEQAWEAYRERGGSRAEIFRRGDESLAQWMDRMTHLLSRDAGHRAAPVRDEDAQAVLDDPEADPEARAGAAVALLGDGEGGESRSRRVRVAIGGVASPRVRVVLDAAVRGDLEEEVLEEAQREHDVQVR